MFPVEGVLDGVLGIPLERLNLGLGEGHPGLDLPIGRPPGQISNRREMKMNGGVVMCTLDMGTAARPAAPGEGSSSKSEGP